MLSRHVFDMHEDLEKETIAPKTPTSNSPYRESIRLDYS